MPGGASQPRRQLDAWQEFARQRGHRGLAYVLVGEDGQLGGPVAKNLSESERMAASGWCRTGRRISCGRLRVLAQSLLVPAAGNRSATWAHRRARPALLRSIRHCSSRQGRGNW
jgi:hypothetical protein